MSKNIEDRIADHITANSVRYFDKGIGMPAAEVAAVCQCTEAAVTKSHAWNTWQKLMAFNRWLREHNKADGFTLENIRLFSQEQAAETKADEVLDRIKEQIRQEQTRKLAEQKRPLGFGDRQYRETWGIGGIAYWKSVCFRADGEIEIWVRRLMNYEEFSADDHQGWCLLARIRRTEKIDH